MASSKENRQNAWTFFSLKAVLVDILGFNCSWCMCKVLCKVRVNLLSTPSVNQ